MLHLPKVRVSAYINWNFSVWEIYLFFHIYLFNHLLISLWTHGYLFCPLGYNSLLLYFVAPSLASGNAFSWLLCFFDKAPPLWTFFLKHLFTFWLFTFWSTGCSGIIVYISCLDSKIRCFSKNLWFLLLENGVRDQDLGAGCAHCYWGVTTFRSFQVTEQGDICAYTDPCVYIHICKHFYM